MTEPTLCCRGASAGGQAYCANCDLLVGLDGLHVVGVDRDDGAAVVVTVESAPGAMGCPTCGVIAHSHGRRVAELVDIPSFGRPTRIRWLKRRWVCPEPACPTKTFTEQNEQLAKPRALLTVRACWWAIDQIRREHASVAGIARQLGTSWRTAWRSIAPLLEAMAADESRFDGVRTLGVDEHIWHHVSVAERGPKELTGMVDLTRDQHGKVRSRLLDLVPGRSGSAYRDWLHARGETFRANVEVATLDPFHGYKNAIDDQLEDAVAVLDAFHVVKLGTHAVDEVRRRVQQEITGRRGHTDDPLYRVRTILRAGAEHLTDRQQTRLRRAIEADERHDEVYVAWQCAQQLRSVYHQKNPAEGRRIAAKIIASFPTCPIPEIARPAIP